MERPASDAAAFVPAEKAVIQKDAPDLFPAEFRPETPEGGEAVLDAHINENAAQIEQDGGRKGVSVRKP